MPKHGPVVFQIPPEHNLLVETLALPYGLSDHALMRPDFGRHKVLAKTRDSGPELGRQTCPKFVLAPVRVQDMSSCPYHPLRLPKSDLIRLV